MSYVRWPRHRGRLKEDEKERFFELARMTFGD